jgi:hypothetical protein
MASEMATTSGPASPAEELASWRLQHAGAPGALLTPDLIAFVQSGVSVALAARAKNGFPAVGLGIGCRFRPDGTLRVLLSKAANAALLQAISEHSAIAVTFSAARDHRAIQVKAARANIEAACSDDMPEMDRQCAVFQDDLVVLGFPPDLARGYTAYDPDQLVAIVFAPDRIFTQTPGPGAGAELTR